MNRHVHNISAESSKKGGDIPYLFQPVVSLRDGSIMGHEIQYGPGIHKKHTGICVPEVFSRYSNSGDERKLFLPLTGDVRAPDHFPAGEAAERIVLEIYSFVNIPAGILRFAVVFDDVGLLYPLSFFSEFHPQYVKLSPSLVRRSGTDPLARALVKSITEFCRTAGVDSIAEGVETQNDLIWLIDIGVSYAQGNFIQEPAERTDLLREEAYEFIVETNRRKNHINALPSEVYIANLCADTLTLPPDIIVETVYGMVKNDRDCFGYCVVQNGFVLGIITKDNLIQRMSGRYGFTLYEKKPVSALMDSIFLSADYKMPVNIVSELAMQRSMDRLYDFIVVTRNGKYLGTVTVRDLLLKSTEIQVASARCQNPLTGLPGNIVIEQMLSRCVSSDSPYCVLYIDINQFKAYNDMYGFEKGDRVIQFLAQTITECLPQNQFAGHVGGDDFVVVLLEEGEEAFCRTVIQNFTGRLSLYYNEEDLNRGYITAENRSGVIEDIPLISLSIAGIYDAAHYFSSSYLLSEELAKLKKLVKITKGSSFQIKKIV